LNREHSLVIAQVRFKGGATKVLRIQLPARAWQLRKTKPEIVVEVDRLLEQCTDSEIAAKLNSKGFICPTPLSPTSEARFRDDAPGNLDSDKNRMDEAWK
jgi:hypothetical protein